MRRAFMRRRRIALGGMEAAVSTALDGVFQRKTP